MIQLSKYKTIEEAYDFGYSRGEESAEYGTCSQSVGFDDVSDEIYEAYENGFQDGLNDYEGRYN